MATRNPDPPQVPWLPVLESNGGREPIAPSKPPVPTFRAQHAPKLYPEPIEADQDEVIAALTPPPPEEILPTDSRAAWESVPVFRHPAAAAPTDPDLIRSLGSAALHRASLSASGAPTPLGGVAPSEPAIATTPSAPSPASAVATGLAGPAPASAVPRLAAAPGFMAAMPADSEPSHVQASASNLEDDSPAYTPAFGTPAVAHASGDNAGAREEPPVEEQSTPWWRSWPVLVIIGLLVMGGVGYAIVTALSDSEPVELTAPVIVAPPEEPTHEPISIEDPTVFQQALPETVGVYALTAADSPDVSTLDLAVRAAEASLLTYQYQDITLSVRAVQHFDAETAIAHFEQLAADGTDRVPVSAGAADVGERVNITAQDGETIAWRNTTALFLVSGPAAAVEEFFANFPL